MALPKDTENKFSRKNQTNQTVKSFISNDQVKKPKEELKHYSFRFPIELVSDFQIFVKYKKNSSTITDGLIEFMRSTVEENREMIEKMKDLLNSR